MFSRVFGHVFKGFGGSRSHVRETVRKSENWFAKARILALKSGYVCIQNDTNRVQLYAPLPQALFFMRACLVRRVSCFRASSLVRIRARECMHL